MGLGLASVACYPARRFRCRFVPPTPRPSRGDADGFIEECRCPTRDGCPVALAFAHGLVVWPPFGTFGEVLLQDGPRRRRDVGLQLVSRRRFCDGVEELRQPLTSGIANRANRYAVANVELSAVNDERREKVS